MMKRFLVLVAISVCMVFLVGCERVRDLSDEETQLIAEYAAELLLRYDINYKDRIDEGNEQAEDMATGQIQESVSVEMSTEESSENHAEFAEENTTGTEEDDKPIQTETDIARIAGIEGTTIKFREYSILERYPTKDEEGEYIYLDASEGYQLLVLYFDIKNTTDSVLNLSLIDEELNYRMVCNGSEAAKPMLTILMDDLGTLETSLEPEEKQEAVLLFQISDGMQEKLEKIDLYITYNETDNVINILQ